MLDSDYRAPGCQRRRGIASENPESKGEVARAPDGHWTQRDPHLLQRWTRLWGGIRIAGLINGSAVLLLSNRVSEVMELVDGSIELTVQPARSKSGLFVCDGHQRRPMFVHSLGDSPQPPASLITRTRAQLPESGVRLRHSSHPFFGRRLPWHVTTLLAERTARNRGCLQR
jgi:hypothetical protein